MPHTLIPASEEELDDLLSRPTATDREAMTALDGDIMILGAGGKMGPSLARPARRAADESGARKRIVAVARFSNPALAAVLEDCGVEVIQTDLLATGALAQLPSIPNIVIYSSPKIRHLRPAECYLGNECVPASAGGGAIREVPDRNVFYRQCVPAHGAPHWRQHRTG